MLLSVQATAVDISIIAARIAARILFMLVFSLSFLFVVFRLFDFARWRLLGGVAVALTLIIQTSGQKVTAFLKKIKIFLIF